MKVRVLVENGNSYRPSKRYLLGGKCTNSFIKHFQSIPLKLWLQMTKSESACSYRLDSDDNWRSSQIRGARSWSWVGYWWDGNILKIHTGTHWPKPGCYDQPQSYVFTHLLPVQALFLAWHWVLTVRVGAGTSCTLRSVTQKSMHWIQKIKNTDRTTGYLYDLTLWNNWFL